MQVLSNGDTFVPDSDGYVLCSGDATAKSSQIIYNNIIICRAVNACQYTPVNAGMALKVVTGGAETYALFIPYLN